MLKTNDVDKKLSKVKNVKKILKILAKIYFNKYTEK